MPQPRSTWARTTAVASAGRAAVCSRPATDPHSGCREVGHVTVPTRASSIRTTTGSRAAVSSSPGTFAPGPPVARPGGWRTAPPGQGSGCVARCGLGGGGAVADPAPDGLGRAEPGAADAGDAGDAEGTGAARSAPG